MCAGVCEIVCNLVFIYTLVLIPDRCMHCIIADSPGSGEGITYKGLFRAAAADANGARLLQQVEVLLLELETFNTAFQTDDSRQLRPVVIQILSSSHGESLSCSR